MRPPRKHPCRHCPTAHFPPDPGALDARKIVLAGEMPPEELLFVCAWSPSRTCRGVYDEMCELKAVLDKGTRRAAAPYEALSAHPALRR